MKSWKPRRLGKTMILLYGSSWTSLYAMGDSWVCLCVLPYGRLMGLFMSMGRSWVFLYVYTCTTLEASHGRLCVYYPGGISWATLCVLPQRQLTGFFMCTTCTVYLWVAHGPLETFTYCTSTSTSTVHVFVCMRFVLLLYHPGGGLGGTRIGAPHENIKYSGRVDER